MRGDGRYTTSVDLDLRRLMVAWLLAVVVAMAAASQVLAGTQHDSHLARELLVYHLTTPSILQIISSSYSNAVVLHTLGSSSADIPATG